MVRKCLRGEIAQRAIIPGWRLDNSNGVNLVGRYSLSAGLLTNSLSRLISSMVRALDVIEIEIESKTSITRSTLFVGNRDLFPSYGRSCWAHISHRNDSSMLCSVLVQEEKGSPSPADFE